MCRCIKDRVLKKGDSSTFSERSFSVIFSFKSMMSCSVSRRKHARWIWFFSKTTNGSPILRHGFWHSRHSHGLSCPVAFRLCDRKSQKVKAMKRTKTWLWRRRRSRLHNQDDEDVYYDTLDADTSAAAAETLEVGGCEGTRPGGTPEC